MTPAQRLAQRVIDLGVQSELDAVAKVWPCVVTDPGQARLETAMRRYAYDLVAAGCKLTRHVNDIAISEPLTTKGTETMTTATTPRPGTLGADHLMADFKYSVEATLADIVENHGGRMNSEHAAMLPADWDKIKIEREIGRMRSVRELQKRIGDTEQRQKLDDELSNARDALQAKGPGLAEIIEKAQAELSTLEKAVSDVEAAVRERDRDIDALAKHAPQWLVDGLSLDRGIAQRKRGTWLPLVSRAKQVEALLSLDWRHNQNARQEMQRHLEAARRTDLIDDPSSNKLHEERLSQYLRELAREAELSRPTIEAGEEEYRQDLEDLERRRREFYLVD